MEREVSSALSIGITLIAVAALISIVWVTVLIGNNIKVSAYNEGSELQSRIQSSQLSSLKYIEGTVMPKAAIYNLLTQENQYISKLNYTDEFGNASVVKFGTKTWQSTGSIVQNFASLQDILALDMTGKSEIYVEPAGDDTFEVSVTDIAD